MSYVSPFPITKCENNHLSIINKICDGGVKIDRLRDTAERIKTELNLNVDQNWRNYYFSLKKSKKKE